MNGVVKKYVVLLARAFMCVVWMNEWWMNRKQPRMAVYSI